MKAINKIVSNADQQGQTECLGLLSTDEQVTPTAVEESAPVATGGGPQAIEQPEQQEPGTNEDIAHADTAATDAPAEPVLEASPLSEFIANLRAKHAKAKPLHPVARLAPAIEPEQFWAMVDDICQNGQVLPIVLVKGHTLDGVIRELACFEAGVAPWYEEWKSTGSPAKLKASLDLFRKHYTPSQRAAMAAGLLLADEEEAAHAAKFANLRKPRNRTKAKQELVKAAGISARTVDHALKVAKEAPKELEKVLAGKKKVSKVVSELKGAGKPKSDIGETKPQTVVIEQATENPFLPTDIPPFGPAGKLAHQLLVGMPELKELLERAQELLNKPKIMFDPETERSVFSWEPEFDWSPQANGEEIRRTGLYISAIEKVEAKVAAYLNDLRQKKRRLKKYQEELETGMMCPLVMNIKKEQAAADKKVQDGQASEPVKMEGA